jgi:hypothetical protein
LLSQARQEEEALQRRDEARLQHEENRREEAKCQHKDDRRWREEDRCQDDRRGMHHL